MSVQQASYNMTLQSFIICVIISKRLLKQNANSLSLHNVQMKKKIFMRKHLII